jgi:hypothetical protein
MGTIGRRTNDSYACCFTAGIEFDNDGLQNTISNTTVNQSDGERKAPGNPRPAAFQ